MGCRPVRLGTMDIGTAVARTFRMDDAAWARHASPWSVWTRVPTLIPLLAAIWSHTSIGWWSLVAVVTVVIWAAVNPRAFPPPATTDNWASKATFGERVWLNRSRIEIPPHHRRTATVLTTIAALAFAIAVVGAWLNEPLSTCIGGTTAFLSKLWFCDRMVWLYEDMKDKDITYRSWLR